MKRARASWPSVDALLANAGPVQRQSILAARERPAGKVAARHAPEPASQAPARKGRQPNKTESAWLARLALDPAVKRVVYEGVTLRLADGMRYTPDCYVEYHDGTLGLDECKGAFVRDTARVKFEWARQQFPGFRWRWCQRIKGEWQVGEQAGKARLSTAASMIRALLLVIGFLRGPSPAPPLRLVATSFDVPARDRWNPNGALGCAPGRQLDDVAPVVAHRTLPCGTRVLLFAPRTGRVTVGVVLDRGPYGRNRRGIDLGPAVTRALQANGMEQVVGWLLPAGE